MGNFIDKLLGLGEDLVDNLERGLPDDYARETDDDAPKVVRSMPEPQVIGGRDLSVHTVGRAHHILIDHRFLLCAQDGKEPDARLVGEEMRFTNIPENAAILACPHCIKALMDINSTLLKRAR